MVWKTEASGVITLNSAGSWLTNLLAQKGFSTTGSTTSVAAVWSEFVGSDRTQQYVLINE